MLEKNQELQSERCVICHKPTYSIHFLLSIFASPMICHECFEQLHVLYQEEKINDIKVLVLYEYNDFFKSLLFQYKAQYDYSLRFVFLAPLLHELQRKYHNYIVVPVPSSELSNQVRGFMPMLEIAKTLQLETVNCLYKKDDYKQSDMPYYSKDQIKDHIDIIPTRSLKNRKVLLIDDVITSSHTMLTCIDLLKRCHPKRIDVLILSKKIHKE